MAGIQLPPGTSLYARYNNQTILNYIEIPILVKIKLGRKLVYYGCFGPHIAFLIEAKTKTNGSSLLYLDQEGMIPLSENGSPLPPFSFNNAANIKESIKKFNAGAQDGIGCAYQFKNANVFFEGRTVIGLTNIQAHPDTDGKNQTGSLIVAAGYMIYIK